MTVKVYQDKLKKLYSYLQYKPKLSDFNAPFTFCDCLTSFRAYKIDIAKSAFVFLKYVSVEPQKISLENYKFVHGSLLRDSLYKATYNMYTKFVKFKVVSQFYQPKVYISRADEAFLTTPVEFEKKSLTIEIFQDFKPTVRIDELAFAYIVPPVQHLLKKEELKGDKTDQKAYNFYRYWCRNEEIPLETFTDIYVLCSFVDS